MGQRGEADTEEGRVFGVGEFMEEGRVAADETEGWDGKVEGFLGEGEGS